ncbi:SDR family oxidoreductase [Bacillus sp. B15-48]|uniref:SDR family oxidoreductase n=1 Tax=Bacillus sp. B15-48 TaxID=1548601 RepID=UPI00193FABF7|nr:SDR family oxidoreductase [Bacillus sp. B15-48]MBM4763336.1 SDR family oxidoreductase [Bacillus sp. B15-48]
MFDLVGKKAIVTGAARGLGKGMARGLHKAGVDVVLIDLSNQVIQTAKEFNLSDAKTYGLTGDLSTQEERHRIFKEVLTLLDGRVDILVNAAGINNKVPSIEESLDSFTRVMNVNVTAVFELSQLAAEVMIKQQSGKIINIGSMTSFFGAMNGAAYGTSKGAIAQLTKSLSNEWAHHGIQVNAIAPGVMATEMTSHIASNPELNADFSNRIPAGRWGTPEDLEGITVFLSSAASNYITGTVIPVDGGYLARV